VRTCGGDIALLWSSYVIGQTIYIFILSVVLLLSEIRTKATPRVEVWQTSTLRRLRIGEEKRRKTEEDRKQKPQDENIMAFVLFHRAAITKG